MEVRPFTIHVPDDVLDDLRRRLGHTRFPDAIPGSGWDYGSNLEYLKALVHYWRTDFDWRAQEAQLNRWHHYTPGSPKFGGKSQIALCSGDERDSQHHHGARR